MTTQHGYTLTEVLVVTVLSALILFLGGSMIMGSLTIATTTRESITTQNDLTSALYRIRSLAGRAISVRFHGGSLNNVSSTDSEGYVRNFSYTRYADDAGGPDVTLMYFNVESQRSGLNANLTSAPQPTAIFYRKPTGRESGRILIATRNGSGSLSPSDAALAYEGIVGVRIKDIQASQKGVLERVTLELIGRHFIGTGSVQSRLWCPHEETSPGCVGGAPYRDVAREMVLSFDNNQREVQFSSFEFGAGTYFFNPLISR